MAKVMTPSSVPIPDEACTAFLEAKRQAGWDGHGGTAYVEGLRAAAPYIDRAARIDELRREIDYHMLSADRVALTRTGTALRLRHLDQVHRLRKRIAELEGQDD